MNKGELNEAKISLINHRGSIPFLVSSVYLREKGLGQADVCFLNRQKNGDLFLKIVEVKSSAVISPKQVGRLRKTSDHLGQVLAISSQFEVNFCQKDDHSLFF